MSARGSENDGFELQRSGGAGVAIADVLRLSGIVHGFSTREGGVSAGPQASLSFRVGHGNTHEQVADNLGRLGERVGFAAGELYRVSQVHGGSVLVVDAGDDPRRVIRLQADALVTAAPRHFVAVQTADCVPVLLADPGRRVVAAVHAGWRGADAGVLSSTVDFMSDRFGCRLADVFAAIGPSIGPCCYAVGAEVAGRFKTYADVVQWRAGELFLDLRAVAARQLVAAGIAKERVGVPDLRTCCQPELFYSHRCQGLATGRQLAVIGLLQR